MSGGHTSPPFFFFFLSLFNKSTLALCKHCFIQCPWPHCRPLSTHTSTKDSWTLTGESGSVSSYGVTAPSSWVLVYTRICLCPPRIQQCWHKSFWRMSPKMEKLYAVSKNKTRSWLWLRSWTPYCKIQTKIEESREKSLGHSGMT